MKIPTKGYIYSLYYRKYESCLFVGCTMNLKKRLDRHYIGDFNNERLNKFLGKPYIRFNDDICVMILMFDKNTNKLEYNAYAEYLESEKKKHIEILSPFFN